MGDPGPNEDYHFEINLAGANVQHVVHVGENQVNLQAMAAPPQHLVNIFAASQQRLLTGAELEQIFQEALLNNLPVSPSMPPINALGLYLTVADNYTDDIQWDRAENDPTRYTKSGYVGTFNFTRATLTIGQDTSTRDNIRRRRSYGNVTILHYLGAALLPPINAAAGEVENAGEEVQEEVQVVAGEEVQDQAIVAVQVPPVQEVDQEEVQVVAGEEVQDQAIVAVQVPPVQEVDEDQAHAHLFHQQHDSSTQRGIMGSRGRHSYFLKGLFRETCGRHTYFGDD